MAFWKTKSGKMADASRWKRPGAYFDAKVADSKVEFIEKSCRHMEGELAGQHIKLERWEREIVRGVFGWLRESDGLRLFREVYIEIPKKNGKSTFGSCLALCILYTDGEPGAQISSAAAETEQAGIIFNLAKFMVEEESELKEVSETFRRSIIYKNSRYVVLSADAETKEGKNSHAVLFDELHVQPNRNLYDSLKTGMAARRQPLMIMFTTAGFDRNSICWEKHQRALASMDFPDSDPSFLGVIFAADPEDDWTSQKIWRKANPNLGVSVKLDFLAAECAEAQRVPAYENTFKRLHLNLWTEQETRWMPVALWDKCGEQARASIADFKGRRCFGGLDLSSTDDMTSLALVFPPEKPFIFDLTNLKAEDLREFRDAFDVLMFYWIPEENLEKRVKRDHVPYDGWRDRFLEATPGNIIDYRYIVAALDKCREEYDLAHVTCDPWGHRYISNELADNHGFTLDKDEAENYHKPLFSLCKGSYDYWTPLLNAVVVLVKQNLIAHGNNPILRWNVSNFAVKEGSFGGFIPAEKKKQREKIDGFISFCMALDLAIKNPVGVGSIYESRGILAV